MAVARSDDGSNVTRRRTLRRPPDSVSNPMPAAAPAAASVATAPAATSVQRVATGPRLDDLYRMPMPKLFALAEREGIMEHTGMTRAQLIVAVVRRQIDRG